MRALVWVGGKMDGLLTNPVAAIRVRVFETMFALAFLYYFLSRFTAYREWLCGEGFHYSKDANLPHLPDPFRPVQPWAAWLIAGLAVFFVIGVIANRCRRVSWFGLLVIGVYIQGVNASAAFALNKLFIVGFCVMMLSPRYVVQNGRRVMATGWAVRILQLTFLCQIFHAGLYKVIGGDWLEYSDVLWTHAQGRYRTEVAAWALRSLPMWCWTVLQWAALLFELLGPFLLAMRRTRPVGIICGIGFVLFIAVMMNDLIHFMVQMFAFLTLFFSAKFWERSAVFRG